MNVNSSSRLVSRKRLLIVFGTRPEALKCFPVARAALAHPGFITETCITAQHREMVDQVIELTGLPVDHDLDIMQPGQTLFDVTSRVLTGMADVLEKSKPDIVLVQGDTTTAMTGALAAFYKRIPVAHVEAGLRSHDIHSPFPEELNRKIAGNIATWHFAPTAEARDNLLAEGQGPWQHFRDRQHGDRHAAAFLRRDRRRCGDERDACRPFPLPRSRQEADPRHRPPPREFRRRHRAHLHGAEAIGGARRRRRSSIPFTPTPMSARSSTRSSAACRIST